MRYGFVAKHRGAWPVVMMCEALGISRSGFYGWLTRPRSRRSLDDEVLGAKVFQSFVASDRTYGARRVWHDVLSIGHAGGSASHRTTDGVCRRCGLGRGVAVCRRIMASAVPSRPTSSIANSERTRRTRSGSPTSRTSGRPRAGCTWPSSSISTHVASLAGRCRRA